MVFLSSAMSVVIVYSIGLFLIVLIIVISLVSASFCMVRGLWGDVVVLR